MAWEKDFLPQQVAWATPWQDKATEIFWDTLQNLRNPEFLAENFVQNPEGVHRKFWDSHFSDAVALLELGITILAMHS